MSEYDHDDHDPKPSTRSVSRPLLRMFPSPHVPSAPAPFTDDSRLTLFEAGPLPAPTGTGTAAACRALSAACRLASAAARARSLSRCTSANFPISSATSESTEGSGYSRSLSLALGPESSARPLLALGTPSNARRYSSSHSWASRSGSEGAAGCPVPS